jgi:hypothetical protein
LIPEGFLVIDLQKEHISYFNKELCKIIGISGTPTNEGLKNSIDKFKLKDE